VPTAIQGSKCVRRELTRRKYQVKARYQVRANALLCRGSCVGVSFTSDVCITSTHAQGTDPNERSAFKPLAVLGSQ